MKRLFSIAAAMLCSLAVLPAAELRQNINANREWRFQLGDVANADAATFDDSSWSAANLPHSFSMPYFLSDRFYAGYGWYRKHFEAPAAWSGKRVSLEFDGVFQVAEVFVNGRRIGEHRGGYTGFSFDITDAVKTGDNVVAVRVNNNWDAQLAPRAGEHVFSGGIYRNVRFVVTAPVHVAWYGTFVTTPQVSKESATVNVKTEVVNESAAAKSVTLKTSVMDAKGKTVARMESKQSIAPGATNIFDQTSQAIANPKLWSPEHPNMYSVKTVVLDAGKPVDDYTSPLGFRWCKWTADQGFFLNGEHYYFKGANVHQDHAGWGDAVAESGMFRDVKMMKDAGFDFIRGSHYPHAPAFSDACDELGLLFWSENCCWGSGGFKSDGYWTASSYPVNAADDAGYEASVKASLRDEIRIHRNHPSIVIWSMSDEPYFSEQSVMPKLRKFLKELVAYTHELDPTRPAAIGGCQRGDIDKLGDVAGYEGDGARLFPNPGIPNAVIEYGSPITDRPGRYDPCWGDLPNTPGATKNVIGSWRLPWRSGEIIWCGFDHGSMAGHFGAQGVVDYFRLPKRQWYWYRNEYRHIPPPAWPGNGIPAGLKLTADKTTLKSVDGTDDAQIIVTVADKDGKAINNCPPVTLTIESGPGEFPTGPSITFAPNSDIVIRDGMAAMEFRSYYGGKTVIRATSPGLKDATIQITSRGEPKFIAGKTPSVKPRPYVRFTGAPTTSLVKYGMNNPTRASSEAPGHSGRLANDGNQATFWQAVAGDTNACLQINLERFVTVSKIKLTFPTEGNWRYQIEISDDGETNWKLVTDQRQTTATAKERTETVRGRAPRGRFVRVTFAGTPDGQAAALAEMELTGTMAAGGASADVGAPQTASNGPAHVPAPATGYVEMNLYDGDPPNLRPNAPAERVAGNGFIRNVSVPTIRRYPVDESKSTGVAFVVFPGGGYSFVDMETHATALAKRLGPLGFSVFGLKYRINGGSSDVARDSLLDANRAIRFVRSHAAEWGLAENRISVISYSAGSDLDMRLVAGGFDLGKPTATDPVERKSSRPDFVASICTWAHGGTTSPYQFTTNTPPVYLCHAQDDPSAPITVSRQIDQQLQALHILDHLEIYPTGGHDGFHVGDPNAPNRNWLDNYLPWLRTNNLIGTSFGVAQEAKTNKSFIDYFLPTPIVGSLTTNVWGAATVGPRDPKNGLEDATMKKWNYWDGKIIKGPDDIYHLFASRWDQAGGHGAWYGSVAVHATSTNLCGPYTDQGLCWPDWNRGSGHNVSALQLKDGRYAIIESGIRRGGVFVSDSLNGPWSYLGDVQAGFCTQCNLQIMLRPDGRYQSIISDTTIGLADNVTGPYVAQGSIFKQTGVSPSNMEDPCMWFSGGLYHVIINNWSQRKAYHFTSPDGTNNWQLQPGYAYDPKADFVRYADGAVNHWNKAERPSVYIENGHVAAMTLAVIDVEKEQEHGNDGHGSKIIVIPFDGAALDRDLQPAANSPKP